MTRHHSDLPPSGFTPAESMIPVYMHVQSRRAGKIKGEAKAPGHVDEIELTAWRWGAQAGGVMNRERYDPASMGRSQCTYRALMIHKRIDTATTALLWALARNDELREVRLTVRRPVSADGVQEDVFTLTLSDARVVAFDQGAAADGSTREVVTFESKTVQTHYQSGKPRGLGVAHRLPAAPPAQKDIAPALGTDAPGGQVARNAAIEPVRSFREESMAQRKLDDAKALAEHQARLASQPKQYVGPIDDAVEMKQVTNHRLYEQQRLLPKHDPLFNGVGEPYEIYRGDAEYDFLWRSGLERARKDGSWSDHGVRELLDLWQKGCFDPEDEEITEEQALGCLAQWRAPGGRWPGRE